MQIFTPQAEEALVLRKAREQALLRVDVTNNRKLLYLCFLKHRKEVFQVALS